MGTYAPIDYVLYLAILLLVYYLSWKVLFTRVKLDRKFLLAVAPFITLGILLRVLADTPSITASKFWSITPGVYLVTFIIAIISLFLGLKLDKEKYWRSPSFIGTLISFFLFYQLLPYFHYPERIFLPLGLAFLITLLVYLFSKIFSLKIFQNFPNLFLIFAHLLDASATFTAYNLYGFGEEHHLPLYLIKLAGNNAAVMIPAKLILILAVLYLIEKYAEKEEAKVLKFLIFILGIGPGLRDVILPALAL